MIIILKPDGNGFLMTKQQYLDCVMKGALAVIGKDVNLQECRIFKECHSGFGALHKINGWEDVLIHKGNLEDED